MTPLRFSFVLHVHQPVGNFDHVFLDHADEVYGPFLDFLEERELWPIGLHASGPLLEWLGEHHAPLHDRIGELVSQGRVELLGGGWYEPILAALPREDRLEQLTWMQEELARRFGVTPTGAWLTERVWEPDIAADMARAGLEYVLVDDHLALRAGVEARRLDRPLRTESDGLSLDLMTIDEGLRYLIPFRPADEIADELRQRQGAGAHLALIGDDGEKFGGWPRTKEWLYEGGWLQAFGDRMDELRDQGVVRWVTPAQARAELEATGPVYLPTGSYPEMEEWALGGHWKGFLSRYPEANRIHKRMLALSRLTRERGDPPEVRRAVARAQCNDAYWHGVFGGLYMKHLREGVRRQLLAAEGALRREEALAWTRTDVDADGRPEWWVHGAGVSAWVGEDGSVSDLLWLRKEVDVLDVLTRYREGYHEEAVRRWHERDAGGEGGASLQDREEAPVTSGHGAVDGGEHAAADSIHEIEEAAVLERLPPEDPEVRILVRPRVLSAALDLETYASGSFDIVWEAGRSRCIDGDPHEAEVDGLPALRWSFPLRGEDTVEVTTVLTIREDGAVRYEWRWNPDDFSPEAVFAPELSLGADVAVDLEPGAEEWRYPIVTTSKCPEGFEEIRQGTSLTPRWPVRLGRARMTIRPA